MASSAGRSPLYDLAGEPDGSYTLSVRATDAAGNTGPTAGSSFEFDTTAPSAPDITAGPGSSGSDATPSWRFRGEPGGDLRLPPAAGRGHRLRARAVRQPQGL